VSGRVAECVRRGWVDGRVGGWVTECVCGCDDPGGADDWVDTRRACAHECEHACVARAEDA
jgi:hypothetical protein